jgi:regulator of cell morphogenesis and NO signaling
MQISSQSPIGSVVAANYNTASIFKQAGIDYCCNGQQSIEEACRALSLDTDWLLSQLNEVLEAGRSTAPATDYASWPPDLLADYIEKMHHRYVRAQIPTILPLLEKINLVHAPRHPELSTIKALFETVAAELLQHLSREEQILFPYIRKLVYRQTNRTEDPGRSQAFVQHPVRVMMQEHDEAGELFRRINTLSNNYTVPGDACNSYKAAFKALEDFEQDLHLHIHLENNILFPAAIQLERQQTTLA